MNARLWEAFVQGKSAGNCYRYHVVYSYKWRKICYYSIPLITYGNNILCFNDISFVDGIDSIGVFTYVSSKLKNIIGMDIKWAYAENKCGVMFYCDGKKAVFPRGHIVALHNVKSLTEPNPSVKLDDDTYALLRPARPIIGGIKFTQYIQS